MQEAETIDSFVDVELPILLPMPFPPPLPSGEDQIRVDDDGVFGKGSVELAK